MKENNFLYICNAANYCNKDLLCLHKIPHKLICLNCYDDNNFSECNCEISELCSKEGVCCYYEDGMENVKCIPYFPDFIKIDEMEI